jgi:hypothetical protein
VHALYGGGNQNDSDEVRSKERTPATITLNQQSVERGLGLSLMYHDRCRMRMTRASPLAPVASTSILPTVCLRPIQMFPEVWVRTSPECNCGDGRRWVALPGQPLRCGSPMLAVHIPPGSGGEATGVESKPPPRLEHGGCLPAPAAAPLLSVAMADDTGLVIRRSVTRKCHSSCTHTES